jgi:hypothetical protein
MGAEVHGILLWPLGGLAFVGHSTTPKKDMLVALAGPLTHIPMFMIWFALLFPATHASYGNFDVSLGIPPPENQFLLAVVAGGCQVGE